MVLSYAFVDDTGYTSQSRPRLQRQLDLLFMLGWPHSSLLSASLADLVACNKGGWASLGGKPFQPIRKGGGFIWEESLSNLSPVALRTQRAH